MQFDQQRGGDTDTLLGKNRTFVWKVFNAENSHALSLALGTKPLISPTCSSAASHSASHFYRPGTDGKEPETVLWQIDGGRESLLLTRNLVCYVTLLTRSVVVPAKHLSRWTQHRTLRTARPSRSRQMLLGRGDGALLLHRGQFLCSSLASSCGRRRGVVSGSRGGRR